jgi:hypothetical protein
MQDDSKDISINDIQLRGAMGTGTCVIEPKPHSVQYSGQATLTWTVGQRKFINEDLTVSTIAQQFVAQPSAKMILKALKNIAGNTTLQINQVTATDIDFNEEENTGTALIVPVDYSTVYKANDHESDQVLVNFTYNTEPVPLNTIITVTDLGAFDHTASSNDIFGALFRKNPDADVLFEPEDLVLTIDSGGVSATLKADDDTHYLGEVTLF